jgi:hypothetical protein
VSQNYAGTWSGTYTVSSCTNSGFFADSGFCSSVLNTTAGVTFTLAQTDRTVSGNFHLGSVDFPSLTSNINADGTLPLASSVQDGAFTIDATWMLQQASPSALTGQTRQVWKATGQSGDGTLQGQITSVVKAAPQLLRSTSERSEPTTLQDLVRATIDCATSSADPRGLAGCRPNPAR